VFWAVHKIGAAISPANPSYGAAELAYQLNDCGAIALVTSAALLSTALEAVKDVPAISRSRVYVLGSDTHSSQMTVEQLILRGQKSGQILAPLRLRKGEGQTQVAFISYSSGTTGLPKGVLISHYNVIANVLQATTLEKEFNDKKRNVTLTLLPLYHIYGTTCFFQGD
jgi:acyl-CoA synthetase (AMP-forming)/AMP-acid ligase II